MACIYNVESEVMLQLVDSRESAHENYVGLPNENVTTTANDVKSADGVPSVGVIIIN